MKQQGRSHYCGALGLALLVILAAQAQIPQYRPELCGKPGQTVPLPPGTMFSYPAVEGRANLTLLLKDGSAKTIDLVLPSSVPQVCPIAGDKLLVFGDFADGPHVWIISQIDGKVLDHIGSRTPVVSPDQHWLIYRQFYPRNAVIIAEFYFLYDLTKDAAGNLPRKPEPGWHDPGGRQVYPVTTNHFPLGHDEKAEPTHEFVSQSFYWSADSRFVAFADWTGGTESIVLVKAGEDDLKTYIRPLAPGVLCETGAPTVNRAATLQNVEFIPTAAALPDVWAHFSDIPCRHPAKQPLQFHAGDFRPAAIELHEKIKFGQPAK